MPGNSISVALQRFITQHVHSVEQLEILCVLAGHPGEPLQVASIFQKVQTSKQSIADRLRMFASGRLVTEAGGGYLLSAEYQSVAAELADAYRERHLTVIELIYQRPAPSVHDFSAAFRFKKKE